MNNRKKEFNYYKAFMELGSYSLKCAEMLHEILSDFSRAELPDKILEMHSIEHTADLAKHDMMNHLLKEFIPPIEREDINSLAQMIDNVTDCVEDILIHVDILNVQSIRAEMLQFTELIVKCCKCMNEALSELENFKKSTTLQSKIVELNRLEEDGDALYTSAVRLLYQTSKDPVELTVWKEIFALLETCFDSCEDVADDIEMIIMKNS